MEDGIEHTAIVSQRSEKRWHKVYTLRSPYSVSLGKDGHDVGHFVAILSHSKIVFVKRRIAYIIHMNLVHDDRS